MDHAEFFQGMPMAALSLGLAQPLKWILTSLYGFRFDSLCSDAEQVNMQRDPARPFFQELYSVTQNAVHCKAPKVFPSAMFSLD